MSEPLDAEILARLHDLLLADVPSEPTSRGLERLRRDVSRAQRTANRPRSRRWPVLVAGVAASCAAFVGGLVVGYDMPPLVREAAHAIGLPVDSPEYASAETAVERLSEALIVVEQQSGAIPSAALDDVLRADQLMVARIGRLSPRERGELFPTAHQVHLRAVSVLRESGRSVEGN